jgi:hypothetical protein
MPDSTRPQDVDPAKPVVDADETRPPTPQGRADGADEYIGPATDAEHESNEEEDATT